MTALETAMKDPRGYLDRMEKPLQEKLRVAEFIDPKATDLLDVGCANGAVTNGLAHMFPNAKVQGIDLNEDFINEAIARTQNDEHGAAFQKIYLHEIMEQPQRYDAVTFVSVAHEFFSYGHREPSVMTAMADAYVLVKPGGRVIVRDMILSERMKESTIPAVSVIEKIRSHPEMAQRIADFENVFGKMESLFSVNHFLLKYMYTENWQRECPEDYVPISREKYEQLFEWLGAKIVGRQTYLLPYLREKWRTDFNLTDNELSNFFSTTILAAEKPLDSKVI